MPIQKESSLDNENMEIKALLGYLEEKKVVKESQILQFGCGTGDIGQAFSQNGYESIDVVDNASDPKLQICKKKGYREVKNVFIGVKPLPESFASKYDLAIITSRFLAGHFPD